MIFLKCTKKHNVETGGERRTLKNGKKKVIYLLIEKMKAGEEEIIVLSCSTVAAIISPTDYGFVGYTSKQLADCLLSKFMKLLLFLLSLSLSSLPSDSVWDVLSPVAHLVKMLILELVR